MYYFYAVCCAKILIDRETFPLYVSDSLLRPCPVEDIPCLSETTEKFLDRTAAGIPELDIKAIDPIIIDMVCSKGMGDLMVHFRNVNITGLRKQKISDFKYDLFDFV